ncbi:hypothetical protein KI810_03080 [Geobacter luticola]|uniref:Uncharacterized protein n=2 Tax=Geomobilimonas luticola TaxID=1114878 RepID=A0ABS5S9G7_9BACT|nr:hypothetical protein [Geomobilimonas luticola]
MLTTLITYLHFGVMRQFSPAVILEELFYLPLLLGVFRFGVKGTILSWLFVSAAYLPFFFGTWATTFPQLLDRILHIVFTAVFAFVACFLAGVSEKNRSRLSVSGISPASVRLPLSLSMTCVFFYKSGVPRKPVAIQLSLIF